MALLTVYSYEISSFYTAVVKPTLTPKLSEHNNLQKNILSALVLTCKFTQALTAIMIGADLDGTRFGRALLSVAALALSVTPIIITQHDTVSMVQVILSSHNMMQLVWVRSDLVVE
jgi:hypothetical protein